MYTYIHIYTIYAFLIERRSYWLPMYIYVYHIHTYNAYI